jgi:hypothetical protein
MAMLVAPVMFQESVILPPAADSIEGEARNELIAGAVPP